MVLDLPRAQNWGQRVLMHPPPPVICLSLELTQLLLQRGEQFNMPDKLGTTRKRQEERCMGANSPDHCKLLIHELRIALLTLKLLIS